MWQRALSPLPGSGDDPNENLKKISLVLINQGASTSAYGGMEFDASEFKTLTIGSIKLVGTASGSANYIRLYRNDGSTVVKTFTVSDAPQSVDISSYDEVLKLRVFYIFTQAYKLISLNEIELE
jgi:hypothetical protein